MDTVIILITILTTTILLITHLIIVDIQPQLIIVRLMPHKLITENVHHGIQQLFLPRHDQRNAFLLTRLAMAAQTAGHVSQLMSIM